MKRYTYNILALIILMFSGQMLKSQQLVSVNAFDKVVIDAGHGGYDPGASGSNSREKDITLSIALYLGAMLHDSMPDTEVIYTRKDDQFVALHRRAKIANDNNADLFISIHCNSNNSPRPFGAETYVMGLHKTPENLEVAKTENATILLEDNYHEAYQGFNPNLDEDYIMLNMFQSANIEQSLHFSQLIQEQIKDMAGLYDRGVKQAGFVVLYNTTMPGVLVEAGFLSNPREEKYLLQKKNQRKIAHSIFKAIKNYHKDFENSFQTINKILLAADENKNVADEKIYRIWFASFKKEKPDNHSKFKGMPGLWHYFDGDKYQYTFERAASKDELTKKLRSYRKMGKIKKRYLKDAKIMAFERSEETSAIPRP